MEKKENNYAFVRAGHSRDGFSPPPLPLGFIQPTAAGSHRASGHRVNRARHGNKRAENRTELLPMSRWKTRLVSPASRAPAERRRASRASIERRRAARTFINALIESET